MEQNLITVRQVPIIEERLKSIRPEIEERVRSALAMACTEETYKDVKKIRAELSKEKAQLESQRKMVKEAVMKPYNDFERLYKEYIGNIYETADYELKTKIAVVEDGIKADKEEELVEYFEELRGTLGLDEHTAPYAASGIKVGISDSKKSLQNSAKDYLEQVKNDVDAIAAMENSDEIMVEYLNCRSLSRSIGIVKARKELAAEEAKRRAILEEKKKQSTENDASMVERVESIVESTAESAPAVVKNVEETDEEKYQTTFRVTATLSKLKELKKYLDVGGFDYESV